MDLLIDGAPAFVRIGDADYEIDSDFRNCIKFERLMFDPDVSDDLRGYYALRLFYPVIPGNPGEALKKILWFYACGKEPENGRTGGTGKRVYSYEHDSGYIVAAFLSDYGIDLETVPHLHWWKFRALFDSLHSDNMICRIMEYRAADTRKMKGEQKKFYQQMQRLYALPAPRDEAEKTDAINDALLGSGDVSEVLRKLNG